MPSRLQKISFAVLLTGAVVLAGAWAVSAALDGTAGDATSDATADLFAPPSPDATAAPAPSPSDASADLSALAFPVATADLFATPSPDATAAPAPLPSFEPVSTPASADVIRVTVEDLIAAGFKDVKLQPPLEATQRFNVHDTTYFRVSQTNLDAKSRWTQEGAADIVAVFVSPKKGCPPGIAGDPKLITYEGRTQVRFCHSETAPIYIVVTGPDQTKAIELADILDRK